MVEIPWSGRPAEAEATPKWVDCVGNLDEVSPLLTKTQQQQYINKYKYNNIIIVSFMCFLFFIEILIIYDSQK
jgi:hypothetical protein